MLSSMPPAVPSQRRALAKPEASNPNLIPVPFRAGERLDYQVQWSKVLRAATLQLSVLERRPFYGHEAWHFQGFARTIDPMRFLYALDDQVDSYSDLTLHRTLQYEMYLREQSKQENSIFWMSAEGEPAPAAQSAVRVPPGTRDPLGFLYYLRALNWQQIRETRSFLFDGKKLYEVRARLTMVRSAVRVPAGKYDASRIEIRVYERGRELAQTRFWIWLANDSGRTPVLIEAELPFGSARIELTQLQ